MTNTKQYFDSPEFREQFHCDSPLGSFLSPDYSHYQQCENLYDGVLTHYDALSTLIMKNQSMEMDNYQVGIPSPYMNAPTKWALAFGISSRPLMPTSTKVLLSKTVQKETPEFEKELRLSKEDIRLMKQYNMLTVL